MIEFGWGAASEVGRVRKNNQDCLLVSSPMFVVADGMGGHKAGEVAALLAVEHLAGNTEPSSLDGLVSLIDDANSAIIERATDDPSTRGMGTTVVVLVGMELGNEPILGVANVGDSRLYRRAEHGLVQITEDHSLVETLVRDGRLTHAEAAVHPQRNILTRALGIDEKVLIDSWLLTPVIGDRYLLCSDGLFNELSNMEIQTILDEIDSPDEAVLRLVSEASAAGGHDNITVVVVDIVDLDPLPSVGRQRVIEFHPALPAIERTQQAVVAEPKEPSNPVFTWRLGLFVASIVTVMTVLIMSIAIYGRSGYFVGISGSDVAIFKGRPDGILWFDPTFEESVKLEVADLTAKELKAVQSGVTFDSLDEAKRYGFELYTQAKTRP